MLTGILVRFEGGKLVMAATDSYRLAVKETRRGASPATRGDRPGTRAEELEDRRRASEAHSAAHENHVVFVTESARLTTRRIDGQFPEYRQLIPDTFDYELSLPRAEVLDVVRRTAVMAQRNSPLRLRFSEGELTVSAQTQDVGEARESLPVPFAGEPLEIGFNPTSSARGSSPVDSDDLELRLISPLRPGLIRLGRRRLLVPDHADQAGRPDRRDGLPPGHPVVRGLELGLEPGLVLVIGPNGAGKTNLLEAVHVGTQGFSPRARSDAQIDPLRCGRRPGRARGRPTGAPAPSRVDVAATA